MNDKRTGQARSPDGLLHGEMLRKRHFYAIVYSWSGLGHEDWRYVDLKERWPVPKWVVYLVAVQGVPTLFVWLGCLSLYPALTLGDGRFSWLDGLALLVGLGAVGIELAADEQMRAFIRSREAAG